MDVPRISCRFVQSLLKQARDWRSAGQSRPPFDDSCSTWRRLLIFPTPHADEQWLQLPHGETMQSVTGKFKNVKI